MKRIKWTSKGINRWDRIVYVNEKNQTVYAVKVSNVLIGFQLELRKEMDNFFPRTQTSEEILLSMIKEIEDSPEFVSTAGPRKLNLKHGEKYGEWKE